MGCVLTRTIPMNHVGAAGKEPLMVVSSTGKSSSSSGGRVAPLPPVEDAPMLFRPLTENGLKSPPPTVVLIPPKSASLKSNGNGSHNENSFETQTDKRTSAMSPESKKSDSSTDSGVFELDNEYSHVITEYSDPDKIRMVEEAFNPPQNVVDLIVEGHACPQRMTPLMKEKNEQEEILQKLREEGLVVQPEARASGGIKFELVEAESEDHKRNSLSVRRLPPIRFQKRQRKRKRELTYEEINKKLEEAERRRKQMEEEKRSKLSTKDKIEEVTAMTTQKLEEHKQQLTEKMEQTAKSREKQLQSIKEKIRAREEHAEIVRQRKQLMESIMISDGENQS